MARKGENIYKRKDGRWEGRYPIGRNAQGRAKYRSVYGKTYAEVREKLLPLKAKSCQYQESGRLTVGALLEEWLSAVQLRVKPSTYANYRMKADKHILPEFGGIRYDRLTVQMLHAFIERKMQIGLSAKYVSDIVVVMKSMAKYASRVHGFPMAEIKRVYEFNTYGFCPHCGKTYNASAPAAAKAAKAKSPKVYRSLRDKKLFGVCGGIAEYTGLSVTLVRIAMVVYALGFAPAIVYFVLGLTSMMPENPKHQGGN